MPNSIKADICIIGAGSGGLSLAAGAAQLGRAVVLIEKGEMGGDCLNYGCVPSKALLAAASAAHTARSSEKFGIKPQEPNVDFAKVMEHVHGVIATIAPVDSQERFEGFGVNVIRDHGEFIAPNKVKAGDNEITAKHFVVATGSTPFVPPIPGLDQTPYITNETLFEPNTSPTVLPAHLIIVGGGPIGIEMAQAHRRLGADVTVIEGDKILNRDDPEAADVVRQILIKEGITIIEGVTASNVSGNAGAINITLSDDRVITGSHLLMAVGRKPNMDGLGLEKAGIEFERRGIKTDDRLRTTNKRVFAIGDVAGGKQFTHVAGDHASTLVRNILFKMPAKKNDAIAPHVTYCDPELASIGLTEEEARKQHGDKITVARWPFHENDRAIAERSTDGFIKAYVKSNGEILGATIVGKGAGDIISMWSYAIANKQKIKSFTGFIAPYPTRGEISKRAASSFYTGSLFSDKTRKLINILSTFD